ncbi:MAG: hypothetical protein ACK44A_05005 [Roseateles sp.]
MNTDPTSAKPPMTTLAALMTSCVLTVACGGGGGGESASGSQSVTPTSETVTAPSVAASDAASAVIAAVPASAASDSSAAPKNAQALDASDHKGTATPAKGAETAAAAPALPEAMQFASASTQSNNPTGPGAPTSSGTDPVVTQPSSQLVTAEDPNAMALAAKVGDISTNATTVQARLDRLKLAVSSMKVQQHEVKPACRPCLGWGVKPLVVMGTEPYAAALPANWPGIKFPEWKAVLSWFVIYEGVGGSTAKNSAVEVGSIELWYLSKSKKTWQLIQSGPLPKWDSTVSIDAVTLRATQAYRVATPTSIAYMPTTSNVVHGGLPQTPTPWNVSTNKADIDALYLSIKHRLVLKEPTGTDDRAAANFVLQAGVDYYPYMGSRVSDLKAPYVPGAGLGQFIKVSPQWRYSSLFLKSSSITEAQVLSVAPPTFVY